jgi:hypothetical protein
MVKSINTNKYSAKNILKIMLLMPLALLLLIILYVVGVYALSPIFDRLDHDKFAKLDTQMQGLFNELKTASDGVDEWKYVAVCNANRSGWMATGDYNCVTSISTQKTVTSVQEINDLQAKYYPIIDSSDTLTTKTELDSELPSDFGKNFVVSSAEKNYVEMKTEIECNYLIQLNQTQANEQTENYRYGSEIYRNNGNALISLRCENTAHEPWYELVNATSTLIP